MLKKLLIFSLVFSIVLSINALGSKLIDKIVATVNGTPITLYELKNIASLYKAKSAKQLLNEVIDDTIIEQYSKNVGITVSDDRVNKYLGNLAARNNLTISEFLDKLRESGIDINEYKKGVKMLMYRYTFARRVFLPSVSITKEDIKRYYNLHKNLFKNTNKVAVLSIISLNNPKTAQLVYGKLKGGADFEKMLKKYSLSKKIKRAIPIAALNPYLQKTILNLKEGEFTNIIESDGKFYIVKLIKIEEENEVNTQITNILTEQQIEKKLKSWLKMIRARADIELFLK